MESLKEKFNITKNSLFDWSIIEKKTNIDKSPSSKDNTDLVSTTTQAFSTEQSPGDSIIKIEITDIKPDDKLNSQKILDIKNNSTQPNNIKVNELGYNKLELHTIDELNSNLSNLIDKISKMTTTIEILEEKINSLEDLSKTNNYNQLLSSPYLGGLSYPFYNFYLDNCNFDNDSKTNSLDEIKNCK